MPAGGSTITVRVLGDASGLSKTLAEVETTAGGSLGKLGTHAHGAGEKLDELGKKGEHASQGGLHQLEGSLGHIAEGFAALEVIKTVYEHFDKTENAVAGLNAAMGAAGETAGPGFKDKLEEAEHAGVQLGFSNDQTVESLKKLREAGIDTSTAMEYQSRIADLARAKGISLAEATDLVTKAMQGGAKGLKEFNIEGVPHLQGQAALAAINKKVATETTAVTAEQAKYNDAVHKHGVNSAQAQAALGKLNAAQQTLTTSQATAAEVQAEMNDRTSQMPALLDQLSGHTGGQAVEFTKTLSGQMQVLSAKFFEVSDKLMEHVVPALNVLLGGLGVLVDHSDIVVGALGTLVGLFVAWKLAVGAVALLANPVFLIVTAVVALIAILVGLELKFHIVSAAVAALQPIFETVWNWIKDHWPLLLDILLGPFGFIIGYVIQHFSQITEKVGEVIDWVKEHWTLLLDIMLGPFGFIIGYVATHFSEIKDKVGEVIDGIKGFFGGLLTAMYNFGHDMIQRLIDGVVSMAGKAKDIVGGIVSSLNPFGGGDSGSLLGSAAPKASGGAFAAGQSLLVGEQGPERVRFGAAGTVMPHEDSGGGGDTNIHVTVNGSNLSPWEVAAEIAWQARTRGL